MRQIITSFMIILILIIGLSGCTTDTPISEEIVNFNIEEVITTSELEVKDVFTDGIKIEVSNNTSYVIIVLSVDNKENKWLTVQTGFDSLTDDEGNKYNSEMFVEINGSHYSTEQLELIDYEEDLAWNSDISPNSTQIKKTVFELPIGRTPMSVYISYGFKSNKLANVERWYHETLELPQ